MASLFDAGSGDASSSDTPTGEVRPVLPPRMTQQRPQHDHPPRFGRLVAVIISAGLAWAIAVALVAWLAGMLLSHS